MIFRTHLAAFHQKQWKEVLEEEGKVAKSNEEAAKNAEKKKENSLQPKIKETINKLTKTDLNGPKQAAHDKRILEFLACTFVPFNVVDMEEWKRLIESLDKTINLKTARTYSRQMEKFAAEVRADVVITIENYCDASLALTTDLWTSRARDSYISVTIHFIDIQFRLHRWTPYCSPFADRHTGDNIQEALDMDIELKLKVSASLPKWGVSDNASNMVKALNQSILELFRCLNHTQQLGIIDTMKALKSCEGHTMEDTATGCKKLAAHLHRADVSRKLLFDECEVTDHYPKEIPIANETRLS